MIFVLYYTGKGWIHGSNQFVCYTTKVNYEQVLLSGGILSTHTSRRIATHISFIIYKT